MAKPNSYLTRLRRVIAGKIEPVPDEGEGWCIRCSLNGGRTAIISETGVLEHAELHMKENPPAPSVKILTN